jgi:type I restriction enzyme S subunit
VLRPNEEINSDFLFAFVQSPNFVEPLSDLVKGALYPAVTDKQVKAQLIPLPPIEEQKEIAEKLNEQMQEVEKLKKTLTEQLEAIKKMPSALLRKAFAGEI